MDPTRPGADLEMEGEQMAAPVTLWFNERCHSIRIKTCLSRSTSAYYPPVLCAGLAIVHLTPSLPSDAPLSFPGPSGRIFRSGSKSQCRVAHYQIRQPVSRLILDVERFLTNDIN